MIPGRSMPSEPSVLDWVRSVLRGRPVPIPEGPQPPAAAAPEIAVARRPAEPRAVPTLRIGAAQIRVPGVLLSFLIVQAGLEAWSPRSEAPVPWLVVLVLASSLLGWSLVRGDLPLGEVGESAGARAESPVRASLLLGGAILSLATFLLSGGNTFRLSTVLAWSASVFLLLLGFWDGPSFLSRAWTRISTWVGRRRVDLSVDGWMLAAWGVLGLAAVFRFYRLEQVPLDMWSDHAEKLLDVMDVLAGKASIFFLRNTGREPIQFYLAAATARWLGTGLTFLTLKLGIAVVGWLTLPFVYLFAREFGGRRVALAAMFLAGIAFWPNSLARTGLRFSLLPFFAAPMLFFLVRGLRAQRRNDLLLAGLCLGLGLYGYSPARILPFVLVAGVGVYLIHREARGRRAQAAAWLAAAGLILLAVLVPLIHAALTFPDPFLSRTLTRLTSAEQPLPGPALSILVGNIWNALKMFNWDSGDIWVVTLSDRPLFDWVTGAFFLIGAAVVVTRYVRHRLWMDLLLLVSIPILMAPSILALAFPNENPAPNRASGALAPAFTLAAIGAVAALDGLRRAWPGRTGAILAAGAALLLGAQAASNNARMMFETFPARFRERAWNTLDAGRVIRGFAESIGSYATAHVVPFPHWMDTRLVGFQAGRPGSDFAWPADQLEALTGEAGAQLFLVHVADVETMERLRALFPTGTATRFLSGVEGRDFWIYFVPPRGQVE